jgi:N-methylhydantoinase A
MREILAEEYPEAEVTLSYDVLREYREFERASSTVVSAFTKPVVKRYISSLQSTLSANGSRGQLFMMNSSGGVMTTDHAKEQPVHMVESGPAAGIIGAVELGQMIGISDLIAFDMGGTTVKASLVKDSQPSVVREYRIGKYHPIAVSVLDIVELGAGGGSIAWIDESGLLKVGPRSAGADPGPVCYGWGGTEPTLTDANVVLGRFNPHNFWGGELQLDADAAQGAIEEIAKEVGIPAIEAAGGISNIVVANMKAAVRIVSVERGYDVREFALVAYGGSGPLFATRIARELGIPRVVIPFAPANFSAWGMLMTDVRYDRSQTYVRRLDRTELGTLDEMFRAMEVELGSLLEEDGVPERDRQFSRRLNMRYYGQEHTIEVPVGASFAEEGADAVGRAFDELHLRAYKQSSPDDAKEVTALRVTAIGVMEKPKLRPLEVGGEDAGSALVGERSVYLEHDFRSLAIYDRTKLLAGNRLTGPAVIEEPTSTTVLWGPESLVVDRYGNLDIDLSVRQ